MTDEAKKLANEYAKEWRDKNKDKIRQYNVTKWEKKAAKLKEMEENKENG